MSDNKKIHWIKDEDNPKLRSWEEFYRNRWQSDKIVRSTHGVQLAFMRMLRCGWMTM